MEAQNQLTDQVLEQCKTKRQFKELLTKVFNYPIYSCPFKQGDRSVTKLILASASDFRPALAIVV